MAKNLLNFGRVVFELRELTDRQTERQNDIGLLITIHNTSHPLRGPSNDLGLEWC